MKTLKSSILVLLIVVFLSIESLPSYAVDYNVSINTLEVSGSKISAYIYKPIGSGPFPLIVLSHGSPRQAEDRHNFSSYTLRTQAEAFVENGAAVAVPIRRGYGDNDFFAEYYKNDCSRPNFYDAGLEGAKDIKAAIDSLASDREIDLSRVVLVGVSAGGFASIAAGASQQVLGIVSFAGGRGSKAPGVNVCVDNLKSAMSVYGKSSREPELWIYSENDQFFSPEIAKELNDAFVSSGGHTKLVIVPAYKLDGHRYFSDVALWSSKVFAFLKEVGFSK